jgi:hypothetical protein
MILIWKRRRQPPLSGLAQYLRWYNSNPVWLIRKMRESNPHHF